MTTITAKNTKAEILAEALPLIDDQAEKIQTLTEKLNAALILLGITAAAAAGSAVGTVISQREKRNKKGTPCIYCTVKWKEDGRTSEHAQHMLVPAP
jgi:hypothetical protein